MASFPDQLGPGAFIPLTDIFDSQHIYELEVGSPEFKEFLVRLRQSMNDIAMVLNIKDTGYYVDQEFVNGQAWFPNPALTSTTSQTPVLRQVFRKVINFGTLPNAGTTTVAHGIDINAAVAFSFTRIYGTATDPNTEFIPLPYASPTDADNIELSVDVTNVSITTGSDRTGFTTTYVVLEYIKQ